jgi:hypothetical protein
MASNKKPLRDARIQYHEAIERNGTGGGGMSPWSEDKDNPMSPSFLPPDERTPTGESRWWALALHRKKSKYSIGVFD